MWNEFQPYNDVLVEYFPWNTKWRHLAEQIYQFQPQDDRELEVYVYCYSYGGGWGLKQLSKHLADRGIRIKVAVLCDAVWRGFGLGKLLSVGASFLPWPKIDLGGRIDEVHWYYQRTSWLCGHNVTDSVRPEVVRPGILCPEDHYHIDDNKLFRKQAMEVARRCLNATSKAP